MFLCSNLTLLFLNNLYADLLAGRPFGRASEATLCAPLAFPLRGKASFFVILSVVEGSRGYPRKARRFKKSLPLIGEAIQYKASLRKKSNNFNSVVKKSFAADYRP
ncbi:MAG: hypothetical protein LUD27_02230, partial [Clostridia bacterium]|nr:hypothetical protein [Clostridia bacterium]